MMVTGIATVLYMTMFSGAGKSFVKELGHDINPHDTRDAFYWGRYVDWILTTPLMLWDVLALAGAPSDDRLRCRRCANTFCSKVGLFRLRHVVLWTRCQSSLEIHHRQHCWKGSTKPLLQSSVLDHCALDSLPTRLDRL